MKDIERSAGVIPVRKNGDILIIQDHHGNWGFPKGHIDGDETPIQAATRELYEETGLEFVSLVESPPLITSYINPFRSFKDKKEVQYFIAHVSGKVRLLKEEIQSFDWVPLDQLETRLTFKDLIKWVPIFKECLKTTS